MRNVFRWLSLLLLSMATSCAQLGLPTAQTFNQKLAVGYGTVTTARNTAATLLTAGKITADDAQNVQNQADNIRAGLDIARQMNKTDPTGAGTKLDATIAALQLLQTYLTSKGGNP
jgi:hypothetical protein